MQNNAQGDKPKVYRRSSLKCRQLVHKLDPDEILKAKPKEKGKGKRNSVSWGLSNTFEFKAMKAMFQESKEIDKKETPEEKEKHEKFIANRKASIKNEFSLLKEMMKKSAASIIEEENDEETRKNMKKNLEMGKEALKEVSESSEQSKSKNSSKSGSRSGSRSRSKSGSKSGSRSSSKSKSNSKSGSRSASRSRSKSKSKSKSKSPSRHVSDDEKETEKVNIKKKRKVQMEDKPKEESEKESENKETEKVSIKKKRKVKVAEAENESENDKKNEKDIETEKVSIKKKRKVKVAEKEDESENNNESEKVVNNKKKKVQVDENDNDEKESEKEPEKINIKKNRKVKLEEASDEDKKEDTKPFSGAKVSLITLKEASNLDLNKIAYITMTDGSVAVLTKEGEKIIQKYKPQDDKFSSPNQKMNLNSKPNMKQNFPQKTLGSKISQNNPAQRNIVEQNNNLRNPEIPEEKLFYNRFIQNANNNIKYNKPGGVGSARYNTNTNFNPKNNSDVKKLRYYSNYKEPNRTVLNHYLSPNTNNYYPSSMPYEGNKTFTLGNPNINNTPNPTILNQTQYPNQQYIRYSNSDSQDLYMEPNVKSNYHNYQTSAKYIYSLQNKYANQNRNNQVNYTNVDDLSNLTQSISPREEERPIYKIIDGIPVKLCDNCNLVKHKTQINPSSRIVYPFYNSQIIESDSLYPHNNRYQYQYQTSSLNYPFNNKINSFEQDIRVFNSYNNLDEPKDLRNEGIYKTYELKYSKITGGPELGKLKNQSVLRRELMRPVSKPLLNKRNQTSRFRYVRIQPTNYTTQNYKETQGFSFKRK